MGSVAAFLRSGLAVRGEGSGGVREAFVLLNHCLDLAEAADDDSAHLLDYTDFGNAVTVLQRSLVVLAPI